MTHHPEIQEPVTEIAITSVVGGFFAKKSIKWIISAIALAGVVATIGFGYRHYDGVLDELSVTKQNNTKLVDAKKEQDGSIKQLKDDIKELILIYDGLNNSSKEQAKSYRDLEIRLKGADGNYGKLESFTYDNPEDAEDIINKGTHDFFRCFEILSGAQKDIDETNSECPNEFSED